MISSRYLKSFASASLVATTSLTPSATFAQNDGSTAALGVLGVMIFVFSMIFVLAWFAFCVFVMVYWILMIIDCIKRENWESENDKTLWILIILLAGIIGALIYRFVIVSKLGKAGKVTEVQVVKKTQSKK